MVRANGANTNTKIRTPFSCPRSAEDRGSMHPSRPRQAERVARWLSGQRRARGPRGQASGAARASVTGTLALAAHQRPASSRTTRKDFW
jgi:hypothetical protein